jgi:selenocysteine-specific elongation factor
MSVVVGTAGHIDHGKTTLLRALTGIDADRLPEERARGMTIDVGYAYMALDDGSELDFVDVPGHDRLVGNMLVGAGEIDAVLLIVAADDGSRAQTLEHLELLDALGISIGLAVVTKTDAVSAERVAAVTAEVAALLERTTLAGSAVVAASATSGEGLDAVRGALTAVRDRVVARGARRADAEPPLARLAIDRVFTVRGRGTVVTGTLRGASIETGGVLRIVPDASARSVRVREVQVHGRTVDAAGPGRVALNVAGSDALAALERGTVLTTDPGVVATDRILVALRPAITLGAAGEGPVRTAGLPPDRAPIAIHLGTARMVGRLGRSGRDAHDLGGGGGDGEGAAIVRLDRPIAAAPGDRFVLRRPSPTGTLAGGRVLDPLPERGIARRRATPSRVAALAAAEPASPAWHAARLDLHGAGRGASNATTTDLAEDVAAAVDSGLANAVAERGRVRHAELIRTGATILRRLVGDAGASLDTGFRDRAVAVRLARLIADGRLGRDGDTIRPAGVHDAGPSPALAAAMDRLVHVLAVASPPGLAEAARSVGCPPDGIRALERENRIVRLVDDLAWAAPTYRDLAGRALAMAATAPLTPAALRDATGTSRKYVMAILEDLDRRAILRRTPAGHVPGPRAATAVATVEEPVP